MHLVLTTNICTGGFSLAETHHRYHCRTSALSNKHNNDQRNKNNHNDQTPRMSVQNTAVFVRFKESYN